MQNLKINCLFKYAIYNLFVLCLLISAAGCSSPEEKADKYFQKGMALLEKNPDKARLEFYNALQMKKNMTKAMYGLALVAEKKGEWKVAYDFLNQVLEQDANNLDALVKSGQLLLAAGKLDLAIERSDKALTLNNMHVGALVLRAALQLRLNDKAGAVLYANRALSVAPNNADAYTVLATERLFAKDDNKAIEYFDKILDKNAHNLAVQLIRIKALENLSKLDQAELSYKKLIEIIPNSDFAKKSYAQFLVKQNRQYDAELQLRSMIKPNTKEVQARLDLVRFIIATKGGDTGRLELESFLKSDPKNYGLAFALVNLYQAQKDVAKEDNLLNRIAKDAGDTSDGLKARAMIAHKLIKQGRQAEATQLLEAILIADKSNGQALTIKAGLAMDAKNYDEAIADLRTVLRDTPEFSAAGLMLASAYESVGSLELAEEQYTNALANTRFSSLYVMTYAQFLLRHKKLERAGKVLQDALVANPNNAELMQAFAQLKISQGDYDGAQLLASQAKEANKSSAADQILGAISSSKKDIDGSLAAYLRAHESDPNDSRPITAVVSSYMQAGKSAEALAFIDGLLKDNPNYTEVKLLKGQIYSLTGDNQKADQTYVDVIKAQPNNALAYRELAISQQRQNLTAASEKTLNEAISVIPNDFELRLVQASIFEVNKRYEEAIKSYQDMLKLRPNSPIANNNLANLLLEYRQDKASHTQAYELSKSFKYSQIPQLLDTYGWASFYMGKLDDAELAIKSATEKLSTVPVFHFHMAKIYIAKNDKVLAKQALLQAIDLAKNQPFDQLQEANQLIKTL